MTQHAQLLVRLPCLLAALVTASHAIAQSEPARASSARPVRIVVPFLGNGIADSVARFVAARAQDGSKTAYQIENRPGDDGHFGAELVSKAEPDGATLLFAPLTLYAAGVSLYDNLHYKLESDFEPITLIANAPHVLVAHPSLPVKSVKEIVALAKSRPGQIRWLSHGKTSMSALELEMFNSLSGARTGRSPESKSGTVLPELIAGHAELAFDTIAATLPHIKSGKLRAIALAGSQRSPALRELPTIAEAGVAGFEANYWYALLAPEGASGPNLDRIREDFARAVNSPVTRERLVSHGVEARSSTSAELAKVIHDEVARWAKVIKTAGAARR